MLYSVVGNRRQPNLYRIEGGSGGASRTPVKGSCHTCHNTLSAVTHVQSSLAAHIPPFWQLETTADGCKCLDDGGARNIPRGTEQEGQPIDVHRGPEACSTLRVCSSCACAYIIYIHIYHWCSVLAVYLEPGISKFDSEPTRKRSGCTLHAIELKRHALQRGEGGEEPAL